jgi:hypothetical protein
MVLRFEGSNVLSERRRDFIRFQIIAMGLGPFATITVNVLPHA